MIPFYGVGKFSVSGSPAAGHTRAMNRGVAITCSFSLFFCESAWFHFMGGAALEACQERGRT